MFDPGGSTGHLSACPVLETWRALLCGKVFDRELDCTRGWMQRFLADGFSVFWSMVKPKKAVPFTRSSCLEEHWPDAGELSAVNAICTQLRMTP